MFRILLFLLVVSAGQSTQASTVTFQFLARLDSVQLFHIARYDLVGGSYITAPVGSCYPRAGVATGCYATITRTSNPYNIHLPGMHLLAQGYVRGQLSYTEPNDSWSNVSVTCRIGDYDCSTWGIFTVSETPGGKTNLYVTTSIHSISFSFGPKSGGLVRYYDNWYDGKIENRLYTGLGYSYDFSLVPDVPLPASAILLLGGVGVMGSLRFTRRPRSRLHRLRPAPARRSARW